MPPKKRQRQVDANANAVEDKKWGEEDTTKTTTYTGQRQDEGGDAEGGGAEGSVEAPSTDSELLRLDILGALIQRRCDHIVINILNLLVNLYMIFTYHR